MAHKPEESLCWDCAHAVGGCCWSSDFVPVPGWNALERPIMANNGTYSSTSFMVMECPQFRAESVKDWTGRREINEDGLYLMISHLVTGMKAEYRENRKAREEIREFIRDSIYEKGLLEELAREAEEADAEFEQKLEDMRLAYISNPDLRESIEKKMESDRFKKRSAHDMEKYIRKMKGEAKKHDKAGDAGKAGGHL